MDMVHLVSAYILGSQTVHKPLFILKYKFKIYWPMYL
jgi:hypothetical protein